MPCNRSPPYRGHLAAGLCPAPPALLRRPPQDPRQLGRLGADPAGFWADGIVAAEPIGPVATHPASAGQTHAVGTSRRNRIVRDRPRGSLNERKDTQQVGYLPTYREQAFRPDTERAPT